MPIFAAGKNVLVGAGGLVALHKLGVRVYMYITAEKDPVCQAIVERYVKFTLKKHPKDFLKPLGDICPRASEGAQPPIDRETVHE